MTVDLARRGMLKALGLASTMVAGPGKALAQAAIGAAGAMPAASFLDGAAAPSPPGCSPSNISSVAQFAVNMLEREAWGTSPMVDSNLMPRPSIECFRSASPTMKAAWEHAARQQDEMRRHTIRAAVRMIYDGKIPL